MAKKTRRQFMEDSMFATAAAVTAEARPPVAGRATRADPKKV